MDRREELERKRKKLEEMRARKPAAASKVDASTGAAPASAIDVDELVNSLVGSSVSSAVPSANPSTAASAVASPALAPVAEPVAAAAAAPARPAPKLVEVEVYTVDLPQKEIVTYSKEVQTDSYEEESEASEEHASQQTGSAAPAAPTYLIQPDVVVPPKPEDLITGAMFCPWPLPD